MNASNIFGKKEDVRAILKALGIKEGGKPEQPEVKVGYPREIVEVRADNGTRKTQDKWIEWFNEQGKIMLSMPDLYHAGKTGDEGLLGKLQQDFKDTWEVTSTRLIYQPDSLNAKVVHYFGNNVIEPVETELLIPDYSSGNLVKEVLDDPLGLAFLQSIFGTEDNKEVILENLVNLSKKKEDKIKVWTPDQENRKSVPERRLVCGSSDDYFHVYCDGIYYLGCSCVVRR